MMKKSTLGLLMLLCVLSFSCKTEAVKPSSTETNNTLSVSENLTVTDNYPPFTVRTIAGIFEPGSTEPHLVDGPGPKAKFWKPHGITVTGDGSIYVADFFNQAIRKISIQNKVTTISVPYSGNTGIAPEAVCLAVDGTFYIANTAYGITVFNNKKGINFYSRIGNADSNLDMEGDSKGVFWFVNDNSLGKISGINIQRNVVNFSTYLAPNETLRGIGIGPNGIKYVSTATQLFKVTSAGEITRLYKDYKFIFISGITVTKDGGTIYLADGNAVKKIYQGQITTIANPLPTNDGRDGIGLNADVRSANVALANSEKALFVSDTRNIIRKITLP